MNPKKPRELLETIYKRLYEEFGPQHWWPAEDAFEVIIGAILTQNTNWQNVEKAIQNLKKKALLTPSELKNIPLKKLANLIKPAGYYNLKAQRLKSFISFLFSKYQGSLDKMFKVDPLILRSELLSVKGIGLETADSILLYAGNFPIFVVDAYTKRFLLRHDLIDKTMDYSQIQSYFMDNLEVDRQLFNEYHALLVRLAKTICKKDPSCNICPLKELNKLIRYQCDSCGKILPGLQQSYILKIELYAYPKVIITKEDLKKNTKREMAKLLRQLKDKDTKELEEEVYASYKLSLCKKCRDIFLVRVKNREFV